MSRFEPSWLSAALSLPRTAVLSLRSVRQRNTEVVGVHMVPRPSQCTEQELPAQDQGYAAWSFLVAAAVVGAVTWSVPFSFGILIESYLELPEIASQFNASKLIPLIGTMSSGIIYCSGILAYPYMSFHRSHARPLMWLGMNLCWISLLAASYSTKVYEYIIFQGVLYGIGGGLVTPPGILYMFEWFSKRRGLANGILFGGMGIGSLIMPFVLPPLVQAYGLFVTLRITAIATLVLLFPSLMFIRPRSSEPQMQVHKCSIFAITASSFTLRNRAWWTLVAANAFQGFAYFVPLTYVPTFTSALNLDSTLTSLALALLNVFFSAGPLLVGFLSDYFTPWPIAFILSVLSLLCTVVFWGAIGGAAGVMMFVVTYGFVAGGWSTLWSSFVCRISYEYPSLSMSLYGILMLTRGLGNILSTPISTTLTPVQSDSTAVGGSQQGFVFNDGQFAHLIWYIAACYAAATFISVVGWHWESAEKKNSKRAESASV